MKALKAIAVATLFAVPMSASAMCNWEHETSTVSACEPGQTFDEVTQSCVDTVG